MKIIEKMENEYLYTFFETLDIQYKVWYIGKCKDIETHKAFY